jgi:hypothetical protein
VLALASAWEALFLRHGLNALDEGWPLYAAMQVHEGGVLCRDVFWVFPPGHLLPAWVGYALAPPGVIAARVLYAAFGVALCVALYFLGRRLMEPTFALLGACLLAVAAPVSHASHLLFGYRYLVFGVLALLAFAQRLRTGDARWMLTAGLLTGIQVVFRWDPAVAVAAALGAGTLAAGGGLRRALGDGARFAAGVLAVAGPVVAWLAAGAGLGAVLREALVRPLAMTELQSLPVPELGVPVRFDRWLVRDSFYTFQFRLYPLLYLAYASVLGLRWARALRARRPFGQPLLLALVVFGGLFSLRSFGRADEPHLDSALPPACLLLAHAVSALVRRIRASGWRRSALRLGSCAAAFAAWVFLNGSDRFLDPVVRGNEVRALGGATAMSAQSHWRNFDRVAAALRGASRPGERILDLSFSPLFYVVSGRRGPGGADVVMPGTFLDESEERAFLAHLEREPPALVLRPRRDFDEDPERSLERSAPLLAQWVAERYQGRRILGRFLLMVPRPRPAPRGAGPPGGSRHSGRGAPRAGAGRRARGAPARGSRGASR